MTRALASARGSIPVAMLAVLIVASLVTVLVGTIVTGQRQTRFDQGFEQSLQAAEIGLDRMRYLVESGQRTEDFTLDTVEVAGGSYTGAAQRDGRNWLLTATGTAPDGTSRTVSVGVRSESVFGVAAFGRVQVALRGNNTADSYRSGTFDSAGVFTRTPGGSDICHNGTPADPFNAAHASDTRMCNPTGNGIVATNEELFLRGGVINDVDGAHIHYASENVDDPLPGATGFCGGVTETCSSPKLSYFREPIELEPDPVVPPSDLVNRGSFAGATLPAGRQLYTNVRLDTTTVIEGTPENPSVVYLTGTLTVPNHAVVNFRASATGHQVPVPSPNLLIFSAGVGPALRFGNHASFAGAVFAPRATFSGGAAGNIYGSMVTGSIQTQGSWNFHYDDALGDVHTEARRERLRWTEH